MAEPPTDPPSAPPPPRAGAGRIRLRHLQCFLAVARHGTLRAAAEALSITQPAVTKTINELEDMLGARLFVRGRHGAALTPQAERFMPHADASVAALSQAVESVARGAQPAALRIGVLPTVAPFLARVLARPGAAAHVQVASERNSALVERLRQRALDAVLGRLSDPQALVGLTFEHLYAEPMVVAVRPGHALLAAGAPASAALAAQAMVLPPAGTLIRQLADGFLAVRGIAPPAALVETLDTALPRAMLQGGADHLWFTPASAVLADLAAGTLARLPLEITPAESVGLLLRTDARPAGALAAFLDALRAEAATRRDEAAFP